MKQHCELQMVEHIFFHFSVIFRGLKSTMDPRWNQEGSYIGQPSFAAPGFPNHTQFNPQSFPSENSFNGYRQGATSTTITSTTKTESSGANCSQSHQSFTSEYPDAFAMALPTLANHQHHQQQQQTLLSQQQRESSSTLTPPSTNSSPVNETKTTTGHPQIAHLSEDSAAAMDLIRLHTNWTRQIQHSQNRCGNFKGGQDFGYWFSQRPNPWDPKTSTPTSSASEQDATKSTLYDYQQHMYQQAYYDGAVLANSESAGSPESVNMAAYHLASVMGSKGKPPSDPHQPPGTGFLSAQVPNTLRMAVSGLAASGRLSKNKKMSVTGKFDLIGMCCSKARNLDYIIGF